MTANASHPVTVLPSFSHAPEPGASSAPGDDRYRASEEGESSALALTSFMLGIASIVFGWTFVAPLTGIILGSIALRRRADDRKLALWGVWLNGIMLALTVLALLAVLALVGFGLLAIPFLAA